MSNDGNFETWWNSSPKQIAKRVFTGMEPDSRAALGYRSILDAKVADATERYVRWTRALAIATFVLAVATLVLAIK
ncbi:MAG: hypothetical protein WEC34_15875 [Acidimicrobiia bacterium]